MCSMGLSRLPFLVMILGSMSCDMVPQAVQGDAPDIGDRPVRLTILHTSDLHSRLIEYDFDPSFTDNQLGLADGAGPYGGMAEIGYILRREREKSHRVLHLDSGDCFQGAIIFNEFKGTGRLINVDEEISFDFNVDQVIDVKI